MRRTVAIFVFAAVFEIGSATSWSQDASQSFLREIYWPAAAAGDVEEYVREPMPPGFQVVPTLLEGPVYTDKNGRTFYRWQIRSLRNGDTGDRQGGASNCTDQVYTETAGLMSPYPAGLVLPELDTRPSCVEDWPPVLATADAKPIDKWTIIKRRDSSPQWAYDGFPLYTSDLDKQPGDVFGATYRRRGADSPALREPVSPRPLIPAEFKIFQSAVGRLLVDHRNYSIYTWDADGNNKSNCFDACLNDWGPILASETSQAGGEWTVIERSPGVMQWAYRGEPLYRYLSDIRTRSQLGSEAPGWHNVYTQRAPEPPPEFTVQASRAGHVLADAHGMTLYGYRCGDDALDQLACDHPDTPQVYRYIVCGGGDPERCLKMFPPVPAPANAQPKNRYWNVIYIDPVSGYRASPDQRNAMRVWAYRDRPIYTFARDEKPGDISADAWGEAMGNRNGYKAFWLRDDFRDNHM
jgi:predicted lipoprotein with Yx(FWY)xxD motif